MEDVYVLPVLPFTIYCRFGLDCLDDCPPILSSSGIGPVANTKRREIRVVFHIALFLLFSLSPPSFRRILFTFPRLEGNTSFSQYWLLVYISHRTIRRGWLHPLHVRIHKRTSKLSFLLLYSLSLPTSFLSH